MTVFLCSLEDKAERLRQQRDKALESTSDWYDRQYIKFKAHKDEIALYKETKAHHRQTKVRNHVLCSITRENLLHLRISKYVSEMAMRSKIDKALGGKESFPDEGKGKRRAWDDFNLSRVVPKPFRSTYPKS